MKALDLNSPLDAETLAALVEAIRPVELGATERDRMRARILKRAAAPPPEGTITLRAEDGAWRDYSPGVTIKVLREEPQARRSTFLLCMAPGSHVPVHPHAEEEHCLVLEGEVFLGDHIFREGDWHVALPGSTHNEFFSKTGCLLLIRAETPRHA